MEIGYYEIILLTQRTVRHRGQTSSPHHMKTAQNYGHRAVSTISYPPVFITSPHDSTFVVYREFLTANGSVHSTRVKYVRGAPKVAVSAHGLQGPRSCNFPQTVVWKSSYFRDQRHRV